MTSTTEHPAIEAATLVTLVGEVFGGLFGDEPERPVDEYAYGSLSVTGNVSVNGVNPCLIGVACSPTLVTHAASELFDLPAADVTDAELHDVVGELANIIGGNIKSMLPDPGVLSLPTTDLHAVPEISCKGLNVHLTWRHEPLRVSLVLSDPSEPAHNPRKETS